MPVMVSKATIKPGRKYPRIGAIPKVTMFIRMNPVNNVRSLAIRGNLCKRCEEKNIPAVMYGDVIKVASETTLVNSFFIIVLS